MNKYGPGERLNSRLYAVQPSEKVAYKPGFGTQALVVVANLLWAVIVIAAVWLAWPYITNLF